MLEQASSGRLLGFLALGANTWTFVGRPLECALELARADFDGFERRLDLRLTETALRLHVALDIRPARSDEALEARRAEDVLAASDDAGHVLVARTSSVVLGCCSRSRRRLGNDGFATLLRRFAAGLAVLLVAELLDVCPREGRHGAATLGAVSTARIPHKGEQLDRADLRDAMLLDGGGEAASSFSC